jgi:AcrR family transcriptional regulator
MQRQSTRERIIEAAGQLFAEKGFKETTVKDITELAGANLAAVNYYFGDKEKLYEEVILHVFAYMRKNFPLDKGMDTADSPEARFRIIVHNLLYRFISPERPAWQAMLMAQERMNPHPVTLRTTHEEITKTRNLLFSSIGELLGPDAQTEEVELYEQCVVGQILHQALMRSPHAPPLIKKGPATGDEINRLAQYVSEFSLAGMRQVHQSLAERQIAE